jgi:hypothetical protein
MIFHKKTYVITVFNIIPLSEDKVLVIACSKRVVRLSPLQCANTNTLLEIFV